MRWGFETISVITVSSLYASLLGTQAGLWCRVSVVMWASPLVAGFVQRGPKVEMI